MIQAQHFLNISSSNGAFKHRCVYCVYQKTPFERPADVASATGSESEFMDDKVLMSEDKTNWICFFLLFLFCFLISFGKNNVHQSNQTNILL